MLEPLSSILITVGLQLLVIALIINDWAINGIYKCDRAILSSFGFCMWLKKKIVHNQNILVFIYFFNGASTLEN